MKDIIYLTALVLFFGSCSKNLNEEPDTGLNGLDNYQKSFDFSSATQLVDLPSFGEDPSYIENGYLKSPIQSNTYKGLGKKFWFENHGGEPNEAEIEFTIWLDADFQKNGKVDEVGKFSGFEGIYDNSAGWGGKKVSNQSSWSVRIGHTGENSTGKIPLGLYIYHPEMTSNYGTVVDPNFQLNREQHYQIKLYIKLNDVNQKNGHLILSVDGNEIYHSNSWQFRNRNSNHIKSVWLDTYIGGSTPSLYDTYTLMDDLLITW